MTGVWETPGEELPKGLTRSSTIFKKKKKRLRREYSHHENISTTPKSSAKDGKGHGCSQGEGYSGPVLRDVA